MIESPNLHQEYVWQTATQVPQRVRVTKSKLEAPPPDPNKFGDFVEAVIISGPYTNAVVHICKSELHDGEIPRDAAIPRDPKMDDA